jgi:hypothetical protein
MTTVKNMNALMITQYERFGTVGRDEYLENFIHEELEIDCDDMLSSYNEWLLNEHRGDDYIYTDLEEMLHGYSTTDIVRIIAFGKYNALDNYYRFDGYGNMESLTDTEIEDEMKDNTAFLEWYIEENDLIDWEEAEQDIADANELIKQGY